MKSNSLIPLIVSLLLTSPPTLAEVVSPQPQAQLKADNSTLSRQKIEETAQQVTVKVKTAGNEGSGTLIRQEGQVYTVVTNAHVIGQHETVTITTVDGETHQGRLVKEIDFPQQDLALVQFESDVSYTVAGDMIATSLTEGEKVYGVGYAYDTKELVITEGEIALLPPQSLAGGYSIGYSNEIKQGMSGGAVFNEKGQLIGINGRRAYPIVDNYRFEDGTEATATQKAQFRRNSWGIPISPIVAKVEAYQYYQQGWQHYIEGDYEEALKGFDEAIRLYPDYAEAYYWRASAKGSYAFLHGSSYTSNRTKDERKRDLEKALALFTVQEKKGQAYHTKGYLYRLEEEWEKARQFYDLALQINSDDVVAYHGRAIAYHNSEKYDQALADYSKVIELNPPYVETIYNFRSHVFFFKKDTENAFKDINKAIEINPNFALAYSSRWSFYQLKGDSAKASADINQFIQLQPNVPSGYYFRASSAIFQGDFDAALADINKALDTDSDYAPAYLIRSIINNRKQNYQQAISDATKAIELGIVEFGYGDEHKKWLAQTYSYRSQAYFALKDYSTALADAESAIKTYEEIDNPEDDFCYQEAQNLRDAAQLALDGHNNPIVEGKPRTLLEARNLVDNIAQKITVKVDASIKEQGSGFIIARQGDTYTVLTVGHNILNTNNPEIITPDGKNHPSQVKREFRDADLAIIEFTSSEAYPVATFGNYRNPEGLYWVFVSGFPADHNERLLTIGYTFSADNIQLNILNPRSLTYGYNLTYTNLTDAGMSGSPIFDTEGRVIGIHGRAEGERLITQQGRKTTPIFLGWSLGISIDRLLTVVNQEEIELTIATDAPQNIPMQHNEAIRAELLKTIPQPTATDDYIAWINYGNQLYRLDLLPEAIGALNQAIQLKPNSYEAHYALGRVLAVLALFNPYTGGQNALEAFNKVVELNPDFSPGWIKKGDVLFDLEQYEETIKAYSKALEIDLPNIAEKEGFAGIYWKRAFAHYQLGQYDQAIANLTTAINYNPNFAAAYSMRGDIYTTNKQYEAAIADWTKFLELEAKLISVNSSDRAKVLIAQVYVRRGQTYEELEEYNQAMADFNKAIEINPESSHPIYLTAYAERSMFYFKIQKDYEKAIASYTKAIELNPLKSTDGFESSVLTRMAASNYAMRGIAYEELKQYDLAIADLSKAIELDYSGAAVYRRRGDIYSSQGEYEKAIADFSQAIELTPNEGIAHRNRGGAYFHLQNYEQAISDTTKAIELNPEDAGAYNIRGLAYSYSHNYEKAIADYNKALELDPDYMSALHNRAVAFEFSKAYEEAIKDYSQVLAQDPTNQRAWLGRGVSYQQLKEPDKAISDYNQALAIDPNNTKAYISLGNIYREKGDYETAISQYEKVLEFEPNNANIYIRLGSVYREKGDYETAISQYKKAIEIEPENARAYNGIGTVYYVQDNYSKALEYYAQATAKDDEYVWVIYHIGRIYYEQGNETAAIEQWQKALDIEENAAAAQFALAVVYYKQGNHTEALELAKTALELNDTLGEMNSLKDDFLWRGTLLSDAQTFLGTPPIQSLLSAKN